MKITFSANFNISSFLASFITSIIFVVFRYFPEISTFIQRLLNYYVTILLLNKNFQIIFLLNHKKTFEYILVHYFNYSLPSIFPTNYKITKKYWINTKTYFLEGKVPKCLETLKKQSILVT